MNQKRKGRRQNDISVCVITFHYEKQSSKSKTCMGAKMVLQKERGTCVDGNSNTFAAGLVPSGDDVVGVLKGVKGHLH